jgi:hypothetical protein
MGKEIIGLLRHLELYGRGTTCQAHPLSAFERRGMACFICRPISVLCRMSRVVAGSELMILAKE